MGLSGGGLGEADMHARNAGSGFAGYSFNHLASPPLHHPPPDLSHEKQLPVNKHEQKLGRIFKVMSYVENMFRSTLNVPVNWREMIFHGALAFKESL